MLPIVPRTKPDGVFRAAVAVSLPGDDVAGCDSLAIPKSRIFTRRFAVTKRFSGFRSRCTMPLSCAAARPRRSGRGSRSFARGQRRLSPRLRSDSPSSNSETMNGERSGWPMSYTARMFGWLSVAAARASCSKRAQAIGIGGERDREDLDRHLATQARIARSIDLAHAPVPSSRGFRRDRYAYRRKASRGQPQTKHPPRRLPRMRLRRCIVARSHCWAGVSAAPRPFMRGRDS